MLQVVVFVDTGRYHLFTGRYATGRLLGAARWLGCGFGRQNGPVSGGEKEMAVPASVSIIGRAVRVVSI